MVFSCSQTKFLDDSSENTIKESPKLDNDGDTEPPPTDNETATPPVDITGIYLTCALLPEGSNESSSQVGCRIEEGGKKVDPIPPSFENPQFTGTASVAGVEIINENVSNSLWHNIFSLNIATPPDFPISILFTFKYSENGTEKSLTKTLTINGSTSNDQVCLTEPITFESVEGNSPTRGSNITNQFAETHGVTFSLASGAPPLLAEYGVAGPTGYFADNVANGINPDQNVGQFFITDGSRNAPTSDALIIDYTNPVLEAQMDLIDIDFNEVYIVTAYNTAGAIVGETTHAAPNLAYRDGQKTTITIQSENGTKDIKRITVLGQKADFATSIGIGFDNFSPSCIISEESANAAALP